MGAARRALEQEGEALRRARLQQVQGAHPGHAAEVEPGGHGGAGPPGAQPSRRKMSVPFVPPKPKEFESATSIRISRASFGT